MRWGHVGAHHLPPKTGKALTCPKHMCPSPRAYLILMLAAVALIFAHKLVAALPDTKTLSQLSLPRVSQRTRRGSRPSHDFLQPVLPRFRAPDDWLAIVTTAYIRGGPDESEREDEYRRGLGYILSRFQRVAAIVSASEPMPLISEYDFRPALYWTTSPQYSTKSAKESEALHYLVRQLSLNTGDSGIPDSAIVFKASGRYQIARDDFLQAVKANPDYDVWAKPFGSWSLDENSNHKIQPGDSKIFTFYFAMRWHVFRDIYMHVDLQKLETYDTIPSKGWKGYDIESYIMDIIKERGLRLWRAPYLHVIANIGNEGKFMYL